MKTDELNIHQKIGSDISTRRKNLNLTQGDIARKVSLSRASVANIERGKQSLTISTLFLFAYALNTTPSNLLEGCELKEEHYINTETLKAIRTNHTEVAEFIIAGILDSELKKGLKQ